MLREVKSQPRDRIIDTALRLFYEQGYLATGINQIITESQVAKATFYSHFLSKENLCLAYLQARHVVWMRWLEDSVERHKSVEDQIIGVFGFLKEWIVKCNFRGCAFLNIASEIPSLNSKIRDEVVKHKDALKLYLKQMISQLKASDKRYKNIDINKNVAMVYVLVEGAIVASQNYGQVWPIQAAEDLVRKLLDI
jgi:AcrR family transcriptional regulator